MPSRRLDGWRLAEHLPSGWVRDDLAEHALEQQHGWIDATVPGSVQTDLVRAGLLADPYTGLNSKAAEWAADRTWVYHTRFEVDAAGPHRLRFDGVDHAARVVLNGVVLGEHEGMSTGFVLDASAAIRTDRPNDLVVILAPAPREQDQLGRTSLVRTGKSRMGYWWDFCPRMVNLGIVGDVHLESGPAAIDDVAVEATLEAGRTAGAVRVTVAVAGRARGPLLVRLSNPDGGLEERTVAVPDDGRAAVDLHVDAPRLWWPNGYGEQALYAVDVVLEGEEPRRTVFGFRTVELVANDDTPADSPPYVFVVNGRRVWVAGWNWVPVDAYYGDPRPEKVSHLLTLARDSHANLVRVNGVGRIETDHFYAECDRLGLMVWQEFLLTSSATDRTPARDPEFLDRVAEEARALIPRVRNHPSLVLWCAGNELESAEKRPLDDREPVIGMLRDIAAEADPDTVWLPTSARGREPFNGPNSIRRDPDGLQDVHGPWLYQGLEDHYTLFNIGTSQFHSEIGAEAITNPENARAVLPPDEWTLAAAGSPTWRHTSAWWVRPEQWRDWFGEIDDFDRLIAATQLVQAEAVRYAVESNRRRAYRNSGTLPWQFNEPFPMVGSTAAVDYHGRPKALYSAVRTAYAPVALSARYHRIAWGAESTIAVDVWAVGTGAARDGVLSCRVLDAHGRPVLAETHDVVVPEDGAARLREVRLDRAAVPTAAFVLDLGLSTSDGAATEPYRVVMSRERDLTPVMSLPDVTVDAGWDASTSTLTVTNRSSTVAPCVRISDARPLTEPGYVVPAVHHLVLLPSESRQVAVRCDGVAGEAAVAVTGLGVTPTVVAVG